MPTNDGFAGSTLTFGATAQADLRSLSFSEAANEVDVTATGDTYHEYVAGIIDVECTAELNGRHSLDAGETGTVVIAWNDGLADGPDTSDVFIITGRETSGSIDDAIVTTLTFKPYGG